MQAEGNPINALPEDPAILQALLVAAWSERDRIAVERNERMHPVNDAGLTFSGVVVL